MKRYRSAAVLFGLGILFIVYLWTLPFLQAPGIVDGMEVKAASTASPLPVINTNNLVLIEFFAGY